MKAVWNIYYWHGNFLKTIDFLTLFTIKMNVLIGNRVMIIAVTQFIFKGTAAIFNYMNDIFFGKKFKDSEDTRFIHRKPHEFLQVSKAYRI